MKRTRTSSLPNTDKSDTITSTEGFVDVRQPATGHLLFRYDPQRNLIEIQRRRERTVIDLTQYEGT